MRIALASHGSRGDVEPCAALARELVRRGHQVRIAVPPDMVEFVESVGLSAIPYGLDAQAALDSYRELWTTATRKFWDVREVSRLWRRTFDTVTASYEIVGESLRHLADDADLLFSGLVYEDLAANVAEHYEIPFATLHFFPVRATGHLHPRVPPPILRNAMRVNEWFSWRVMRRFENAQRVSLGLPGASSTPARRIAQRKSLELQAYDEIFFPKLAQEFKQHSPCRPFVGALTLDLPSDGDDQIADWASHGKRPIYFGFGSNPVEAPSETIAMIVSACAELGERALICSGWKDFDAPADSDNVMVVRTVNFSRIFPLCRAVVHHGGAGTVAAGLRAGCPTLILWTLPDQPIWATQLARMGVGAGRRFSRTTRETLVEDLRKLLTPECRERAQKASSAVTPPAESVARAADLLEMSETK